jgi:hypothetical protein
MRSSELQIVPQEVAEMTTRFDVAFEQRSVHRQPDMLKVGTIFHVVLRGDPPVLVCI